MEFLNCVVYFVIIGFGLFIIGTAIPSKCFHPEKKIYQPRKWEKGGKIYEKIKIRKWKDAIPDMSKLFYKFMPKKKIEADYKKQLPKLIQETCKAELVHTVLCLLGIACIWIWKAWGWLVTIAYALGNLPFIIVQRYNRPRLIIMQRALEKRERKGA